MNYDIDNRLKKLGRFKNSLAESREFKEIEKIMTKSKSNGKREICLTFF
jgi:hypothetical protein